MVSVGSKPPLVHIVEALTKSITFRSYADPKTEGQMQSSM